MSENIDFLYFLRHEIDGKINELGGKVEHNESFETINRVIQDSFSDIVMLLEKGRIDEALKTSQLWSKKNWVGME